MATKVLALHTVQRTLKPGTAATRDTAAVKPVTESLKPGTLFVIEDDHGKDSELAFLLAAKAVTTDIPKSGFSEYVARTVDGPGELAKEPAKPLTADERAKLVARGKELGVAGIATSDNWKDATLAKKVGDAEAAAAEKDSKKPGGDEQPLV